MRWRVRAVAGHPVLYFPAMRLPVYIVLIHLSVFGLGCAARDAAPAALPAPLVVDQSQRQAPPLRLAPAWRAHTSAAKAPDLPIPLDRARTLTNKVEERVMSNGIQVDIDPVDAVQYDTLLVRLRVAQGDTCLLRWTSDIEPRLEDNPGILFDVIPDEDWRDYVIDLRRTDKTWVWQGRIASIAITTSAQDNPIALESLTLAARSDRSPHRETLDNVTMEAVPPVPLAWRVTVPPRGMLELHVGMLELAFKDPLSNGVEFRVRVQATDASTATLLKHKYVPDRQGEPPRWLPLQADLSEYAGQDVVLMFDTDNLGDSAGDYALWGNPIITTAQSGASKTPVILISCDTMRADHLSCYGYVRNTSPNLDAFAREAVLFERAFTPETWTLTGHVSMLTGLYPTHHRVNATTNLAESVETLPEVLAQAGYATGGFTGYRIWMLPWRGLAHGFDLYSTPEVVRNIYDTHTIMDPWLEEHRDRPLFLFFHNYDLHSKYDELECEGCDLPYYPVNASQLHFAKEMQEPASLRRGKRPRASQLLFAAQEKRQTISPDELAYMQALYDDAIRSVDEALGTFFEKLKAWDLYDRALIIVTADHGEHFGEHGQYLHEHLYEGAARVPLLVKFPAGQHAGHRVDAMVTLMDIPPTVLDVLGLEAPPMDGHSLLPIIEGGDGASMIFIRRQQYQAVRTSDWKLLRDIHTSAMELYQLTSDPKEERNVLGSAPLELPGLTAELERFFLEDPVGWHAAFVSSDPKWRGTLTFSASGVIGTARLLYGGSMSRNDLMKNEAHSFTAMLGPILREEVLFRAASPDAATRLTVRAEAPFALLLQGGEPFTGTEFEAQLDPAHAKAAGPPTEGAVSDIPTLLVWYQLPAAEGGQARELTPEEREQLDGMGYGGSKRP
ncbi:MAG: sulfatase-like hydrolase/transferase [Candidatus Hydrogenedentes bacterium]|nr:sulfatase-like hydrolase/transferase [Candidatus Hydrogenedentota bacterium]